MRRRRDGTILLEIPRGAILIQTAPRIRQKNRQHHFFDIPLLLHKRAEREEGGREETYIQILVL